MVDVIRRRQQTHPSNPRMVAPDRASVLPVATPAAHRAKLPGQLTPSHARSVHPCFPSHAIRGASADRRPHQRSMVGLLCTVRAAVRV
jgi:hypothetical protein